jgi:sec-independent protein translocase protein TatA
MFGFGRLGAPELILILLIALLIFGPRKLPQIGRAIGKAIRELRSGSSTSASETSTGPGETEPQRSDSPDESPDT